MKKKFLVGYKTYDAETGFGNASQWKKAFYKRMTNQQAVAILKEEPESPYSILGVLQDASDREIRQAFRKLIKEWHPDINQHRISAAETMSKKIIAAYIILLGK